MPDDPTNQQLFTEKEISAILKRSAEIQAESDPAETTGLSLTELKQIAGEVGINPAHVESALAELRAGSTGRKPFYFFGGPTFVHLERVVEGEVSPDQWETIAAEIRQSFRTVGTTALVGQSLEWTQKSREKEDQVTVSSRNGRTKIRIYSEYAATLSYFLPVVIPTLIVALVIGPIVLILPFAIKGAISLSIIAFLYMIVRLGFGTLSQKKENKATDLMKRLEEIISTPDPASPQRIQQATAELRIDPQLLEQNRVVEPLTSSERRREGAKRST